MAIQIWRADIDGITMHKIADTKSMTDQVILDNCKADLVANENENLSYVVVNTTDGSYRIVKVDTVIVTEFIQGKNASSRKR